MKGLLLRLSAVDADAEAAVRVIAYFDALVENRATPADLVRAAAALAECPAGLDAAGEEPLRFRPDGSAAEAPVTASGSAELGPGAGHVWLAREGGPGPLDDLVLERMAISARLVVRPRTPAPHLADPALVELVLSEREAAEDRARALRLLGIQPGRPVRVVAVTADGTDPGAAAVALVARGRPGHAVPMAVIGGVAALLLQPRDGVGAVPADLRAAVDERVRERRDDGLAPAHPLVRVGVGGAVPGPEARTSWTQAQLAVRFAVAGGRWDAVVDHASLGSLALLAELPPERLRAQPDVAALDLLAATPAGALDLAALEAFCCTGTLRQAAALLHLHHSSVAARLAHVEDALGWRLADPGGRFRARFALLARRLAG